VRVKDANRKKDLVYGVYKGIEESGLKYPVSVDY
jgi:hypothetical protein